MYPNIVDDDLIFHENKEKVMLEKLCYKLGKTEDELRSIINTLD
jgi:hypothetical protein